MRTLIILVIKSYWFLIPKEKRRHCVFRKSCSNYVYEVTQEKGFVKGIKAFIFRFRNCRNTIEIFKNPIDKTVEVILPNKKVLKQNEVSKRIVSNFE